MSQKSWGGLTHCSLAYLCKCDAEASRGGTTETDSAAAESRRDAPERGSETPAGDGDEHAARDAG